MLTELKNILTSEGKDKVIDKVANVTGTYIITFIIHGYDEALKLKAIACKFENSFSIQGLCINAYLVWQCCQ